MYLHYYLFQLILYNPKRHIIWFLSDEGPMLETLDYTIRPYWQYTDLFIFRFIICLLDCMFIINLGQVPDHKAISDDGHFIVCFLVCQVINF